VLVIGTLGLGAYMVQLVENPADRFDLTQTHKSIGVTVFALTLVRLGLRIGVAAPKPEPGGPMLLLAAKVTHVSLYALLLMLPLSGWLMITTTPVRVPTTVFGLFQLPYPLTPDMANYQLAHAMHVTSAVSLAVLIVLHIGAALVHELWWRDHIMARIWHKPNFETQRPFSKQLRKHRFRRRGSAHPSA
jgi:cytochrome b561